MMVSMEEASRSWRPQKRFVSNIFFYGLLCLVVCTFVGSIIICFDNLSKSLTALSDPFFSKDTGNYTLNEAVIKMHGLKSRCPVKYPMGEREADLLKVPPSQKEIDSMKKADIHFISYASKRFSESRKRLLDEAQNFGRFASVTIYQENNLSFIFHNYFREILKHPKGGGFYVWKPFIIREAIEKIPNGSYLVWVDTGSRFVKSNAKRFDDYLIMLQRSTSGFLVSDTNYSTAAYTSGRIFETFGLLKNSHFMQSTQIASGFIIMKKQDSVIAVLDMLIDIVFADKWIMTNAYWKLKAHHSFVVNRNDQSLIDLLLKCFGRVIIEDYQKPYAPIYHSRIRK